MSSILPEPFEDPQALVGMRRRGRRLLRELAQGRRVEPLNEPGIEAPATRGDVIDCALALGEVVALLTELVEVDSGEVIAVRKRYRINAATPFRSFEVEAPDQFHAVKIDNPSAVDVDVVFSSTQPNAGNSDERVPPRTGRIITAPYDQLAIGIDPAVMPGGDTILYVTYYSRPYQPTTYAFAP